MGVATVQGRGGRRTRRRAEAAQSIHLADAARMAGEAFACDEDASARTARGGAGWNAAGGAILACAMLYFGL